MWCLLQIAHAQVVAKGDFAAVVVFLSGKDAEQRAFACTVFGDEANVLPFSHGKGNIIEEHKVSDAYGEMLYIEIGCHFLCK